MPKNPQMSVIWDWFHCAAVRSRRNGTSPRTVTSVLKWTGYRAGFAHGETLEIRVCGRGLSSSFATGYGVTSVMARSDWGKAIFIAKDFLRIAEVGSCRALEENL
jgi:hypothetical protein